MKDMLVLLLAACVLVFAFGLWNLHGRVKEQEAEVQALRQAVSALHLRTAGPAAGPGGSTPIPPTELPPPITGRFNR